MKSIAIDEVPLEACDQPFPTSLVPPHNFGTRRSSRYPFCLLLVLLASIVVPSLFAQETILPSEEEEIFLPEPQAPASASGNDAVAPSPGTATGTAATGSIPVGDPGTGSFDPGSSRSEDQTSIWADLLKLLGKVLRNFLTKRS